MGEEIEEIMGLLATTEAVEVGFATATKGIDFIC
jgi:hypothetical protein